MILLCSTTTHTNTNTLIKQTNIGSNKEKKQEKNKKNKQAGFDGQKK